MSIEKIPEEILFEAKPSKSLSRYKHETYVSPRSSVIFLISFTLFGAPGALLWLVLYNPHDAKRMKRKWNRLKKLPFEKIRMELSPRAISIFTVADIMEPIKQKLKGVKDIKKRAKLVLDGAKKAKKIILYYKKNEPSDSTALKYNHVLNDLSDAIYQMKNYIKDPKYSAFTDFNRSPIANLWRRIRGKKSKSPRKY